MQGSNLRAPLLKAYLSRRFEMSEVAVVLLRDQHFNRLFEQSFEEFSIHFLAYHTLSPMKVFWRRGGQPKPSTLDGPHSGKVRRKNIGCAISCLLFASLSTGLAGPANPTDTTQSAAVAPASSPGNDFWTQDGLTGDWNGYRKRLEDQGVTVGLDWVTQGFDNFQGGIHAGTTFSTTADLSVTFDADKLLGLHGGKFYADLEDHAGPDPSQYLVGDIQKFNKLNSSPFLQIAELWYEQTLFDGKLRLKLGKVDANSEFSVVDNGQSFLNSSNQESPTIIVLPTFPDPLPGANVFFTPNDTFYASFGAYYATKGDKVLDFTGSPAAAQLTHNGMFFIGETGLKWKHLGNWQEDGNFRLGLWGDTGTFPKLAGSRQRGTDGIYIVTDQTLWKPTSQDDEARGLRSFLEYGATPGNVSIIDRHFGGGLTWTGLLPGRPADIAGFGPQYVHFSDDANLSKSFELAIEGFYQYQFAKWATVQPDLQWICHPGGQYANAVVGTLQIECHF